MINEETVRSWLTELSKSQGKYEILLEAFDIATPAMREALIYEYNRNKIKTIVDFVIFLES